MSVSTSPKTSSFFSFNAVPSDLSLVQAVDAVPETQGMGVTLIANGVARSLRATPPGASTVVFEYRPSPVSQTAPANARPRGNQSSPAQEWLGLGLNCGGAVLSWVGVAGTAATAPVTGGQSLWGTAILWGGALASSASCSVSVFRVGALLSGNDGINQTLDGSGTYVWTMRGLDVVGLIGVGGAFKDIMETRDALDASGVGWKRAVAGEMSRPQRRVITKELGLLGNKRVAPGLISSVVKQRLLGAIAAGIGMGTSALTGATHDLVVWIITPGEGQ